MRRHTRLLAALLGALGAAVFAVGVAWGAGGAAPARTAGPAGGTAVPPPALDVTGAALIDASTGQLLYGRASAVERAIASTTKIMTALITLRHVHHLGQVFAQNDYVSAPVDSQIGLAPGERMSVHDLLLALLLPSADDAAEDLAYNVGGGSVTRFVAMMNAEAVALGLRHTHYSTPIGLDTPGNYSTPADLVRLTAYVRRVSTFFRRAVALPSALLRTGRYPRRIVNLNDLVARFRWINGVKTGHTLQAGYVLVASGTRDGTTLIDAVLGTPSEAMRDADALALLRYGFTAFRPVTPIRRGEVLARIPVRDRPGVRAAAAAANSFMRDLPRADAVSVRAEVPGQLAGPLPRGAVVGHATVTVAGRAAAEVPLVLTRALPAVSPVTQAGRFLTRGSTLVGLAAALLAGVGATVLRRRRPKTAAGARRGTP
jgi:D-alanyl-D-alanine carboxypeptidase (penicillin-binding protein 5/6)